MGIEGEDDDFIGVPVANFADDLRAHGVPVAHADEGFILGFGVSFEGFF